MGQREEWETPGSFARSLLDSDALAVRFRDDTLEDNVVLASFPEASSPSGIGGWSEYDPERVVSTQPLKETNYSGRRVDSMSIYTFDEEFEQTRAFVTQYPLEGSSGEPRIGQAHSQMAVWAFCDALGIDVPRHQWLYDERKVVVEEVGTPEEKTWTVLAVEERYANEINHTQLQDLISVQLLAGVEDLSYRNLNIGESGRAYVFDFDKADQQFKSTNVLRIACGKICRTIKTIDEVRTTPLQIDRNSICARVQEIATGIANSPHRERILKTVQRYDEVFINETEQSFVELFDNNISILSAGSVNR